MGKMTFVVEFEDGKEPPVSADMDIHGGRVLAASWSDYRADLFTQEQADAILDAIDEAEWHGQVEEDLATWIRKKLEILTE